MLTPTWNSTPSSGPSTVQDTSTLFCSPSRAAEYSPLHTGLIVLRGGTESRNSSLRRSGGRVLILMLALDTETSNPRQLSRVTAKLDMTKEVYVMCLNLTHFTPSAPL